MISAYTRFLMVNGEGIIESGVRLPKHDDD